MAFNKNEAESRKVFKKFIGIDKGYYLLPYVNLDNEKKEELGLMTFDNETEYIRTKENNQGELIKTVLIELYAKASDSSVPEVKDRVYPLRFYIDEVKGQLSSTGKYEWINKYGETTWQEGPTPVEVTENSFFHYLDEVEHAYKGEGKLIQTIRDIFGATIKTFTRFDISKLFAGNFTEITDTIKAATADFKEKDEYKPFCLVHMIYPKVITDETGTRTKYIPIISANYGVNIKNIRYNLTKNNYTISYLQDKGMIYRNKDGILPNYLIEFDETQVVNLEDTTASTDNISEIPDM